MILNALNATKNQLQRTIVFALKIRLKFLKALKIIIRKTKV
jgi:hypothetical protein